MAIGRQWMLVILLGLVSGVFRCSVCSFHGTHLSDSQKEDIQSFTQQVMECYSVPGMALVVAGAPENDGDDDNNDYWTYTTTFGKADVVKDVAFTNQTLFPIGSLTKGFTSALLAMLIRESNGKFKWTTPVRDILGDSFYLRDEYISNKVTLVDLLSHRLGMAAQEPLWKLGFLTSREELVKRLHLVDMEAEFRTEFINNDLVYALAGAVAEKIGGKSWEELIREKIFRPLGMDTSTFLDKMAPDFDGLARAHYWMNNGTLEQLDTTLYQSVRPVGPAASIVTNAEDMAEWLLFPPRLGKNRENVLLIPPPLLFYTHKPQITVRYWEVQVSEPQYPVSERYNIYGMGWYRGDYNGHGGIMHDGNLLGHSNRITLHRTHLAGVFSSMNGPLPEISKTAEGLIHMYISDIIMQREPWLTAEKACSFPQPWEPQNSQRHQGPAYFVNKTIEPERDLKDFAGTYGNYLYGELSVWANTSENRLEAKTKSLESLAYHFAMYPTGMGNEFQALALGPFSFFHASDVFAAGPPAPPVVKFITTGSNGEVNQLQWTEKANVIFEKDLDVSKVQKPDFLEKKDCDSSGSVLPSTQTALYLVSGTLLWFCTRLSV